MTLSSLGYSREMIFLWRLFTWLHIGCLYIYLIKYSLDLHQHNSCIFILVVAQMVMSLNLPSMSSCHSNSAVSDIDIVLIPLLPGWKKPPKLVVENVLHVCHLCFVVNKLVIVLVWYRFVGIVMALENSVNLFWVIL